MAKNVCESCYPVSWKSVESVERILPKQTGHLNQWTEDSPSSNGASTIHSVEGQCYNFKNSGWWPQVGERERHTMQAVPS